jgi:hypothetical protein
MKILKAILSASVVFSVTIGMSMSMDNKDNQEGNRRKTGNVHNYSQPDIDALIKPKLRKLGGYGKDEPLKGTNSHIEFYSERGINGQREYKTRVVYESEDEPK